MVYNIDEKYPGYTEKIKVSREDLID